MHLVGSPRGCHILKGIDYAYITALASLLYALERLGIEIGWINPWAWNRKRKWLKQYHANPAFSLEKPVEAVGLLLTATAKIDDDLSSEEKSELRQIFEDEFHLSSKESGELLNSSTYLLGSGQEVFSRPKDVLAPSLKSLTQEQKQSSIMLLKRVAEVGSKPSEVQQGYIKEISSLLLPEGPDGSW